MINEKWLKISIFIPIWGTAINVLMLFIEYAKHKSFRFIKLFGGMALSGFTFGIVALLFGQVIKYIFAQIANLQLNTYIILLVSFIIAGIVMNVIFVLYYRKVFSNIDNKI